MGFLRLLQVKAEGEGLNVCADRSSKLAADRYDL